MLPAQVSFNLVHGVAEHARSRPYNVGLVVDDRACTYAELASLAGRFARWLDSGSQPDANTRRVGVVVRGQRGIPGRADHFCYSAYVGHWGTHKRSFAMPTLPSIHGCSPTPSRRAGAAAPLRATQR